MHSSLVATTVAFAMEKGMTLDVIESTCGVSAIQIMNPDARIPDDAVGLLWQALMDRHPGVPLSMQMARAAPLTLVGGIGHGALYAENLGAALEFLERTRALLADRAEVRIEHGETEYAFSASHPSDEIDQGRGVEGGLATIWRMVTEILDIHTGLLRVEFVRPPFGPEQAYEQLFGAPIAFGRQRNALIFDVKSLGQPISRANAELFSYVQRHFDHLLDQVRGDAYAPELTLLREAIVENAANGEYGATLAAERARLSLRSAQRLASDHGTSLQQLVDEVRASNAKEFLARPGVSVETASRLTGYSDPRAFRRAFKRWTGASPSTYARRRRRAR